MSPLALPALFLLASLAARAAAQMFEVYPSRPDVSWTTSTRLGLGASAGEILMHVPGSHFRSVGNRGAGTCDCVLFYRFEVRFWDGDRSTPEVFTPIIRDWTGTAPGVRLNPLTAPKTTPAGPVGPGLVTTTMYFLAPQPTVTIPCDTGFCIGVEVGAATYTSGVLTEGLEVLAAAYQPGGVAVPATGDYPRAGMPSYAWSKLNGAFPWVNAPATPGLTLAFAVDPRTPLLNIGNRAPAIPSVSFGVGGMHPDCASPLRLDGLDLRIQDHSKPNGFAWAFAGVTPTGGIPIFPPVLGCLEVIPMLVFPLSLDGNGVAQVNLVPDGLASNANFTGTVWVQSVVMDSLATVFHFSNAQAVDF